MDIRNAIRQLAGRVVLLALGLFCLDSTPGRAQGCAMCYNAAASMKAAGIRALDHGILILLFPPLILFLGIFVLAFRRPERYEPADGAEVDYPDELPRSA